jgi:cytochrome c-type biogenesis protein
LPPVGFALLAGGLSTVNPCGFALLPAYLSLYVGAPERVLPRAPTRIVQGLLVGIVVSAGLLTVFTVVGVPIIYGAAQITRVIRWFGLAVGIALALIGAVLLVGGHISIPVANPVKVRPDRRLRTMFLFGMGYGIASLGCTLPVFLATVGASLATRGAPEALAVLAAYGVGTAMVIVALSLMAAFMRRGLARVLTRIVPYMNRVAGTLLLISGAYLSYYWARVALGSAATLSDDPLIGAVERFVAVVQRTASSGGGRTFVLIALAIVAAGVLAAVWRRSEKAEQE